MAFGATVPPRRGFLPTRISNDKTSNRYCIHNTYCRHYKKSKNSGNTIGKEFPSRKEIEEYLKTLPKLSGGIHPCGSCLG
jgi:hypothetical protein